VNAVDIIDADVIDHPRADLIRCADGQRHRAAQSRTRDGRHTQAPFEGLEQGLRRRMLCFVTGLTHFSSFLIPAWIIVQSFVTGHTLQL
jgi:hypothetical protein